MELQALRHKVEECYQNSYITKQEFDDLLTCIMDSEKGWKFVKALQRIGI